VVICVLLRFDNTDNAERLDERPRHRDRLTRLHADGELVMAGPWADDSGALLIFSTTPQRVAEILAEDPYYSANGVDVVARHEWNPPVGARTS
jgi:hypothetical protein